MFFYALYSTKFTKISLIEERDKLFPKNKTDAISLLSFCGNLCDISFPICVNIIKSMKHFRNKDDNKTVLETNFWDNLSIEYFEIIEPYLPLIIIITIVLTFFNIVEKCQRKKVV